MTTDSRDYLKHYGILGMKWGVRKDGKPQGYQGGKNTRNKNYTPQQVKRDTQLYGRRGSKRINRRLNEGDTISVARGYEVNRRDKAIVKQRKVRTVGGVVGGAAGVLAVPAAKAYYDSGKFHKDAFTVLEKMFGNSSPAIQGGVKLAARGFDFSMYILSTNKEVRSVASLGAAMLGRQIGQSVATKSYMKVKGYDPDRKYS